MELQNIKYYMSISTYIANNLDLSKNLHWNILTYWSKNIKILKKGFFHWKILLFSSSFLFQRIKGQEKVEKMINVRETISQLLYRRRVSYWCQLEMCQPKSSCVHQITTFLCEKCFPIVSLSFDQSDASLFKYLNFDINDEFRKDIFFWKYNLLVLDLFQYISLIDNVYLFFFISCAK